MNAATLVAVLGNSLLSELAPYFAGIAGLAVALVTAYYSWKGKDAEISAPDRLADGFVSLTAELRSEITRLNERVDILEKQRREDVRHIAYLELQIDWVMKRLDDQTRAEFEALFRPFK